MIGKKQFFGCAMVAGLAGMYCTLAHAQSPFEDSTKPSTKAGEKPSGKSKDKRVEKSVLAGGATESLTPERPSESFCQCIDEIDKTSVEKFERALRGPLHSSGLDFVDQPLQDVVSALQDEYGIPIKVDTPALEESGIATDQPVNVSLHNISLRSALKLMLKSIQLTYIIRDEVLVITTSQEAEKQLKTCVYDVSGLTGERDSQVDAIIETIHSCVASDTWAENGGGQAQIRAIKPGLLVISQTAPVHEEIRNLLATVRKMRDARSSKPNAASQPHSANEVVTRSYLLQLNPSNDNDTMRMQVRELIVQSLPEEAWTGRLDDGQAVTLSVFHDRIVVRQTPEVQEKVQKILADSGVAMPAQAVAGIPGAAGDSGFFSPEMAGGLNGPGAAGIGEGVVPVGAAQGIGGGRFGPGPEPSNNQ